jgi:uncharacterized membrane protein YbhN (UPF0104 family)
MLLKAAVLVAVFWFVGSTLQMAVDKLTASDWRLSPATIGLAAIFYVAGLLPAGIYWWWLMKRLHQPVPPLAALRAYFVGHLGKYVPGKAMVVVLRAGMAKSAGADVALATITVLIETLTMMACGAALSLVLVAALVPPDWKVVLAAALAVVTGGPTLPPLLNRLLWRWEQRGGAAPEPKTEPTDLESGPRLSPSPSTAAIGWRAMGIGWAAMLALWLMLGLSLASILSGLAPGLPLGPRGCLLAIAAVALATVAGFLSLFPGGLLVRELILLDLLAPQVGEPTALVAAVLLRLVWLVSELVVSGGLYLLARSH